MLPELLRSKAAFPLKRGRGRPARVVVGPDSPKNGEPAKDEPPPDSGPSSLF